MKNSRFSFPLSLILLFSLVSGFSQAGLVLNPQRIVVLDRERTASLELLNTSKESARFQIYFENKEMTESGDIVDVVDPEPGRVFAGSMVRYSPRRVDIPSQGSQTIRLAIRRPKNLPDGEYLSHLVLKQIPNRVPAAEKGGDSAASDDQKLTLSVQPILKLAIPVIVRKGQLEASASLSDIEVMQSGEHDAAVQFRLYRDGSRSLYGDVEVFLLEGNSEGRRLGYAKGIALYVPTASRLVHIPLEVKSLAAGSKVLVRFNEGGKYGGSNLVEQIHTVAP